MGDAQSRGIGVLNKTGEDINVVLSMAAPHYYENGVKPDQIFYRWPGAVHYTVCVWIRRDDGSNDMTSGEKALGILRAVGTGVAGFVMGVGSVVGVGLPAAALGGSYLAINEVNEISKPKYAEIKGCYAGGTGTWIIAKMINDKLTLIESDASTVCGDETFTKESKTYI